MAEYPKPLQEAYDIDHIQEVMTALDLKHIHLPIKGIHLTVSASFMPMSYDISFVDGSTATITWDIIDAMAYERHTELEDVLAATTYHPLRQLHYPAVDDRLPEYTSNY